MILFTDYVDKASEVSNKTLITTPGTAQYKAMKWIYYDDPFGRREVEDERFLQRYIAAVFYFSTSEGNGWSDCYPVSTFIGRERRKLVGMNPLSNLEYTCDD